MYQKRILSYQMRIDERTELPCKGFLQEIDNTLKAKQEYVGGTIQNIRITPEIDMLCNDDGKLIGLPFNRVWFYEGQPVDFIMGNILFVRHDDKGNYTSILEEDIPTILEQFKVCVVLSRDLIIPVPEEELREYKESRGTSGKNPRRKS